MSLPLTASHGCCIDAHILFYSIIEQTDASPPFELIYENTKIQHYKLHTVNDIRGGASWRGRVSLSLPQNSIAVNAGEIKNTFIFHIAKLIRPVDPNLHIGSINIHLGIKASGLWCVDSRLVLDRSFAACWCKHTIIMCYYSLLWYAE